APVLGVDIDDARVALKIFELVLAELFDLFAELVDLGKGTAEIAQVAELGQLLLLALHLPAQPFQLFGLVFRFGFPRLGLGALFADERHEQKDAEKQKEDVDEGYEEARDAAARHMDHGDSPCGAEPPSMLIRSRPSITIH